MQTIHQFKLQGIDGKEIDLSAYAGKKLLIVNTASQCGFTGQYKELQELQERFQDRLTVLGVPCNQFGAQEPGSEQEIQSFCDLNYRVSFPMTEKMKVKGKEQAEVYHWLTDKNLNGKKSSKVRWNFQKYLIDEQGELIDFYYSVTKPLSKKILKHLN